MNIEDIQEMVSKFGYLALFLGTLVEGELFFILGGVAARQGLLDPYCTALAAMSGAFAGDNLFFWLGRVLGPRLMARPWRLARKAVAARRLIRHHSVPIMLFSRFLYGLRMVVPMTCGTARVRIWSFTLLNLASNLGWTLCFGCLGYLGGGWVMANLGAVRGVEAMLLTLLVLLALGALVANRLRR